jgi:hypothetical protein
MSTLPIGTKLTVGKLGLEVIPWDEPETCEGCAFDLGDYDKPCPAPWSLVNACVGEGIKFKKTGERSASSGT